MCEVSDFIRGQEDCKNGVEHKPISEAYTRGYAAQYELEQMNTEMAKEELTWT